MRILEVDSTARIFDPSEILRPESRFAPENPEKFRDFTIKSGDSISERVRATYRLMHTNQTFDFVQSKLAQYAGCNLFKGTIRETLEKLNDLVDESDPDADFPNILHAFQTAERIRKDFPDLEWFQLTGLIHDLGKILAFFGEPQWAVVGDTFVVGCDWSPSIVYRNDSFSENPDGKNPKYNTKYGVYAANCGLENLTMSWGHDEYLYRVLVANGAKLPEIALKIIRFHSFYPWHSGGDYAHLTKRGDEDTKEWVRVFNRYDLYTKSAEIPDVENLWSYYQKLIDKFIPGELNW